MKTRRAFTLIELLGVIANGHAEIFHFYSLNQNLAKLENAVTVSE